MNYDDRQGTIDGLRQIAQLLEDNPDLPAPYISDASWGVHGGFIPEGKGVPEQIAAIARLIPTRFDKDVDGSYYRLKGKVGAITVEVWGFRDAVCERVVTGTREVTEDVPTAYETVTKTVEDVEWVCKPLLASVTS